MAKETEAQWLKRQFKRKYCEKCGGSVQHHTVIPVSGNFALVCKYPPSEETDWEQHPVIKAFRKAVDHA